MITVCRTDELEEGKARGFELNGKSFFLVHYRSQVYAYLNHCPHLGVNLEWMPDQFLDSDGCLIQCAMHGALFLIESGHCISGPCNGQSLSPLPCNIQGDHICVDLSENTL